MLQQSTRDTSILCTEICSRIVLIASCREWSIDHVCIILYSVLQWSTFVSMPMMLSRLFHMPGFILRCQYRILNVVPNETCRTGEPNEVFAITDLCRNWCHRFCYWNPKKKKLGVSHNASSRAFSCEWLSASYVILSSRVDLLISFSISLYKRSSFSKQRRSERGPDTTRRRKIPQWWKYHCWVLYLLFRLRAAKEASKVELPNRSSLVSRRRTQLEGS